MCGFAAMLSLHGGQADRTVVERMSQMIAHRGPDDAGNYFSGPVGFGFRRLSILDLTAAGHQPMTTPDGQVTLVFNGAIYNYAELRVELEALGHTFRSSGDTEVLLHAYCAWGEKCLDKLNGMWAFLVDDRRRGKLFGSRDRFGIKPLYYHRSRNHFLFASEIKAIRASGLYDGAPHWPTVAGFLLEDRLDESSDTFYEGIEQIPAGTAFEVNMEGHLKQWRYWAVEAVPPVDEANPAAAFAELFEDSMRLHMRSDVPVGMQLSGGLDSTSIICALARLRASTSASGPLKAFSYMSREYDESQYIADTIKMTDAQLVQLETTPQNLWANLGRLMWFQDEPVHSMQPLIGFALMELAASKGVKVILNGQGADETIAGYGSYFRDYWNTLLRRGSVLQAWLEIERYATSHGCSGGRLFMRQLRHLIQSKLHGIRAYRSLARRRNLSRLRSDPWFTPELSRCHPEQEPLNFAGDDLNTSLVGSIIRDSLPVYLRVEDRNSMAHSIEARVPFLDYRLVSFVLGLPANWKMRGAWNKFVLREGMRNRIPESVRSRVDKMGFPSSFRKWFAGPLYEPILDLLHSQKARTRGIYNIDRINQDLGRHRNGEIDATARLSQVIQFEIWSEMQQSSNTYGRRPESNRQLSTVAM
jgi:asparagine synthase (glutamine-hydrolysing)